MKQMTKQQLENTIHRKMVFILGALLSKSTLETVRYEISRRLRQYSRDELDEILQVIISKHPEIIA